MLSYFRSPSSAGGHSPNNGKGGGKRRGSGGGPLEQPQQQQPQEEEEDAGEKPLSAMMAGMVGDDGDSDDDEVPSSSPGPLLIRASTSGADQDGDKGGLPTGSGSCHGDGNDLVGRRARALEWEEEDRMDATLLLPEGGEDQQLEVVEDSIFEHQRYNPVKGWGAKHLLPLDPAHFTRPTPASSVNTDNSVNDPSTQQQPPYQSSSASSSSSTFKDLSHLPEGWSWIQPSWRLQTVKGRTDAEGWSYAVSAGMMRMGQVYNKGGSVTYFRRRVWSRKRAHMTPAKAGGGGEEQQVAFGGGPSAHAGMSPSTMPHYMDGAAASPEGGSQWSLQLKSPVFFKQGGTDLHQDNHINYTNNRKGPSLRRRSSFSDLDPRVLRHPTASVTNTTATGPSSVKRRPSSLLTHNNSSARSPSTSSPLSLSPSITTSSPAGPSPVNKGRRMSGTTASPTTTTSPGGGAGVGGSSSMDTARTKLASIGHQLRLLHEEDREDVAQRLKLWDETEKPERLKRLKALREKEKELQAKKKDAANQGWRVLQAMEDELSDLQGQLDEAERRVLFPTGMLSFGTAGTFVGFTDLWIESFQCQFVLDIVPSCSNGHEDGGQPAQIHLLLCGVGANEGSGSSSKGGFSVRMLAEGFKLKGDKAPVLPVDLSTMKVTATMQVMMSMEFDAKTRRWRIRRPEDLRITIEQFRGPLYSRKNLLDLLLQAVQGAIRTQLAESLPHELGEYLRQHEGGEEAAGVDVDGASSSARRPITIRGELTLEGTKLKALNKKLYDSPEALALLGWSMDQAKDFVRLQKQVVRDTGMAKVKTISSGVEYAKMRLRNPKRWRKVVRLWERAAWELEKLGSVPIDAGGFFRTVTAVANKPMTIHVQILHLDLTLAVHRLLRAAHSLSRRWATDSVVKKITAAAKKTSAGGSAGAGGRGRGGSVTIQQKVAVVDAQQQLAEKLREIDQAVQEVTKVLSEVESRVDAIGTRLALRLQGGDEAQLSLGLKRVQALVPVSAGMVALPLPHQMVMAMAGPGLPILLVLKPDASGALQVLLHEQEGPEAGPLLLQGLVGRLAVALALSKSGLTGKAEGGSKKEAGAGADGWPTAFTFSVEPSIPSSSTQGNGGVASLVRDEQPSSPGASPEGGKMASGPPLEIKLTAQGPARVSMSVDQIQVDMQPIPLLSFIQRRVPMTESRWKLISPDMDFTGFDMFGVKRLAARGRRYLTAAKDLDLEFNMRLEGMVARTAASAPSSRGQSPQPQQPQQEMSISVRPYEGDGPAGRGRVAARIFTSFNLFELLEAFDLLGDNFSFTTA